MLPDNNASASSLSRRSSGTLLYLPRRQSEGGLTSKTNVSGTETKFKSRTTTPNAKLVTKSSISSLCEYESTKRVVSPRRRSLLSELPSSGPSSKPPLTNRRYSSVDDESNSRRLASYGDTRKRSPVSSRDGSQTIYKTEIQRRHSTQTASTIIPKISEFQANIYGRTRNTSSQLHETKTKASTFPSSRRSSDISGSKNSDHVASKYSSPGPYGSRVIKTPPYSSSSGSSRNSSQDFDREFGRLNISSIEPKAEENVFKSKGEGLVGLKNLGNTCFMNSALQCLSNTTPLRNYIIRNEYSKHINSSSGMRGKLVESFASLINDLWSHSQGTSVSASRFKRQIEGYAPQFCGFSQQDSQELLRFLLDGLHEDLNRVRKKPKYEQLTDEQEESMSHQQISDWKWNNYLQRDSSFITDIFLGQLKSTVECLTCKHQSVTFDPFWDLSLPIPSRFKGIKSALMGGSECELLECFRQFTEEEILDGNERPRCYKCKVPRKSSKRLSVQIFPDILVLHIKRFSFSRFSREKLTTKINFPLKNLVLQQEHGKAPSYSLYAVSNHMGGLGGGHYTAICKSPVSGQWFTYNDSHVSKSSASSIQPDDAYVLFYEKQ
eukprot:Nk52_evm42s2657 gene=Nk52_evmTU42s2657